MQQVNSTVIVISGTQGSGKSTLAKHLAEGLRLPSLSWDAVRGGYFLSAGGWGRGVETLPNDRDFLDLFAGMLGEYTRRGVSVVADFVLTAENAPVLRRAVGGAAMTVLWTEAECARSRYKGRLAADPFIAQPAVLRALGARSVADFVALADRKYVEAQGALVGGDALGTSTLRVDTTHGYDPSLEEIMEHIKGGVTGGDPGLADQSDFP